MMMLNILVFDFVVLGMMMWLCHQILMKDIVRLQCDRVAISPRTPPSSKGSTIKPGKHLAAIQASYLIITLTFSLLSVGNSVRNSFCWLLLTSR
jgi:hypothetical protein